MEEVDRWGKGGRGEGRKAKGMNGRDVRKREENVFERNRKEGGMECKEHREGISLRIQAEAKVKDNDRKDEKGKKRETTVMRNRR